MTRVAGHAHNVRVSRPAKEWSTWQGRLIWMVDRVAPPKGGGEMSLRELARRAELTNEGGLAVQIKRVRNGGDMHFSTVAALQRVLGFSWDWLAENKGWPTEEIRRRMNGSAPPVRAV